MSNSVIRFISQIGACVVLEEPRRVLSVGYNGLPHGHKEIAAIRRGTLERLCARKPKNRFGMGKMLCSFYNVVVVNFESGDHWVCRTASAAPVQ